MELNKNKGLDHMNNDLHQLRTAAKGDNRKGIAESYNKLYQDSYVLPPCDIVTSLRNDIENYNFNNLVPDLRVIKESNI